ncbi:VanZ family protein [Brevibacillus halotolerans]|uniref:VanZ family protein n=1 Tax=Brevibacillus halotolerans TaxID=1507437 RepID=UPI0015EE8FE9|nr:VanZ family protein [Brevibacillus halotolerans]MBA4535155.1 VanZ family protein [Brevibacillus halotolerans]WPS88552.1 VanZ family protein [Brevibacillus halotolerans]
MIKKNTLLYNTLFFILPLYLLYILLKTIRLHGSYFEISLIPFDTIISFFTHFESYNRFELLGKILLYIPIGILIPLLFSSINNMLRNFVFTLALSLLMNSMILVIRVGFFDIDDIILNVVGGVIGFVFVKGWFSFIAILSKTKESHKESRLQL